MRNGCALRRPRCQDHPPRPRLHAGAGGLHRQSGRRARLPVPSHGRFRPRLRRLHRRQGPLRPPARRPPLRQGRRLRRPLRQSLGPGAVRRRPL